MLTHREKATRAARSPVVVVLGAIAVLAAASAAWTIGEPGDALRYGLVVAGYGALAITAAVIARDRQGRAALYVTIAALAALSGLVGLVGAGAQEFSFGQRIGGSWQAAGTFEYGPANALLQVAALPILLTAMAGRRRDLAIAAAAVAGIAGAVLGLSDSLFSQLAAGTVLALAVGFPSVTVGRSRALVGTAALLIVAAAVAAHLVAGRFAPLCELGGDGTRLSALAAIVVAAAAIWALARRPLAAERASVVAPLGALAAAAAIGIVGALADPQGACTAPTRAVEPYAGILHGRGDLWEAAWDAGLARPLAGAGADSYVFATAALREGGNALYAHDLPLELFAELGILGLAAAIALYATTGAALVRARRSPGLWLAGPAVAGFMLANLVDFPWHLAGAGAVWALALGVLIASGYRSESPNG